MPITKSQLKSIVKECLVEILAEGIGSIPLDSMSESSSKKKKLIHNAPPVRMPEKSTVNHNAIKNINEAIRREAGGDKVMVDILADTAANTLPAMLESDRTKNNYLPPTGTVERVVASASPDQLFGEEAAAKWASLAFMDSAKK